MKVVYGLLVALGALLAVALIGPFLAPIPPLQDTVPPKQLADPDSRFIELNGVEVHYKQAGQGQPALILLHGFAANEFSWREVITPLSKFGTVIAYDRTGFGLTERPMPGEWTGANPYSAEAQVDLLIAMMDAFDLEQAVLVGNSAGGAIAVLTALRYPERVQALILVDPAIYTGGGSSGLVKFLLSTPQMRRLGPLFARQIREWGKDFGRAAWHDPARFTEDIWQGYTRPLRAHNWDRALWEFTLASQPLNLDRQLARLTMPTLVITGDDDRIVPTAQSVRLAGELPRAELVVIPNCGHVPQEECPQAFMQAVMDLYKNLK